MSPMQALETVGSVAVIATALGFIVAAVILAAWHKWHVHHLELGATQERLEGGRSYPATSWWSSRCELCLDQFVVEITGPINVDSLAVCDDCRAKAKTEAITNTTQEA